jgi:hypothetical protein
VFEECRGVHSVLVLRSSVLVRLLEKRGQSGELALFFEGFSLCDLTSLFLWWSRISFPKTREFLERAAGRNGS